MRFVGQGSETNIAIPEGDFTRIKREDIRNKFDEVYKNLYGRTYPESAIEFINFRVRASLPERVLQLHKIEKKEGISLQDTVKGQRPAYSPIVQDYIPYTVYDRYKLFPGAAFDGPAIIEERESTIVVGEDASVAVDEYGFVWIDMKKEE